MITMDSSYPKVGLSNAKFLINNLIKNAFLFHRKIVVNFPTFENVCEIKVEEFRVQNGLNDTGTNCNQIVVSVLNVALNPIYQIECTIRTQGEQIMTDNAVDVVTSLADHK